MRWFGCKVSYQSVVLLAPCRSSSSSHKRWQDARPFEPRRDGGRFAVVFFIMITLLLCVSFTRASASSHRAIPTVWRTPRAA